MKTAWIFSAISLIRRSMSLRRHLWVGAIGVALGGVAVQAAEIEEITITAEKRESTVSDTPISITAFDNSMIENLGMQGPDDLVNYTPSTTRDAYDIRIRGVGRNFRALGGDPGVATYYNGVYSEDFGIASTENALYDVARIEVLRGPQGTLYGRNAIGGAINYISNRPTMTWTGEVRTQQGSLGAEEYYGIVSGPIIADRLAMRLTALTLERDGSLDGFGGAQDINTINDRNYAAALLFQPTDDITMNVRWNDRKSNRIIGANALLDEGPVGVRGVRNTTNYSWGLRPVAAGSPGALPFTNPVTGATLYGAYVRPGVDSSVVYPYQPSGAYLSPVARLNPDKNDVRYEALTNPTNDEKFSQNAVTADITYDTGIGTFKYIYGFQDFDYTFDIDNDYSNEAFSQYRQTVLEDVHDYSHELQYLWEIGDKITGTSGIYNFHARRDQDYGLLNATAQGRYTNPANYGTLALLPPQFGPIIPAIYGPHRTLGSVPVGVSAIGVWGGDPDGFIYHHNNTIETNAYAAYTQATYAFNDEWALTLGLRWAKDEKDADEQRFAYFEDAFTFTGYLGGLFPFIGGVPGYTNLANANIVMGNATPNADPTVQINPTCGLTQSPCPRPLRLAGIPFSNATHAADDDEWSEVTWRANVDWTPTDNTLVYASVTTGYRAGGYSLGVANARDFIRDPVTGVPNTSTVGAPFQYDKETVISYEIGYKSTFFDESLQLFASTYLYDYEDYQDQTDSYDAIRNTGVDTVTNAPKAQNFGIELESTWLPTDAIRIGANYSYTQTEYSDTYLVANFNNPALPPSIMGSIGIPANRAIYVFDVEGNDLKRIPEHKATAWGEYTWATSFGDITSNATVIYIGSYYNTALNESLDETPDSTRVDASLSWASTDEKIRVRAFVDNVFDEGYISTIDQGGEVENWQQVGTFLYPRFYGIDIRYAMGDQ